MSVIGLDGRGRILARGEEVFRRLNRARSWLGLALVAALLTIFVRQQWSAFPSLQRTVGHASLAWLGVAAALQAASFGITAAIYVVVLRRLGHRFSWLRLADACLRSSFVSILSPIRSPVDAVVIVSALDRGGVPVEDGLFAWSLVDVIGFAGGFALLAPTVALLAAVGRLSGLVLAGAVAAAVVLLVVAALVGLLARGGPRSRRLERRLPKRLTGLLDQTRAHEIHPAALAPALALAVLSEVVSILVLAAALHAVGYGAYDPKTPLVAYEAGSAAGSLAPVYQGVGAVELAMTSMLHQERVAPSAALAATILFRLAGLWLPVAFGLSVASGRRLWALTSHSGDAADAVQPSDHVSE